MDLSAWMAREGLNLTAAAERLQLPVPTLHNYVVGYRRPSLDRAKSIVERTGGAVSLADLLPELAAAFGVAPICQGEPGPAPESVSCSPDEGGTAL